MKLKLKLAALAMLIVFNQQPATAFAQGTAFTYQGRLNAGANAANGIYDLRFAIYDSTNHPGTLIAGPITNSATGVTNGLFTVTLDFGSGVFNGADRWLDLAVRTNGTSDFTPLLPRQWVTPAPDAIYAATAMTATTAKSVATTNLTGTVALAQLPAGVMTNGASGVNLSGTFTGDGSGLTHLDGAAITAGTVSGGQIAPNSITAVNIAEGSISADAFPHNSRPDLLTITNPAPGALDNFGNSAACVGTDRFVIGAVSQTVAGIPFAGQAYLYDAHGMLMATITNPAPYMDAFFGNSVARVGPDRFVIGGGQTDQAYLYDTGGALVTTIPLTNPAPADGSSYDYSVAGVGTDRFVIGTPYQTIGGISHAGQAYLYDKNGTLVATITNPVPAAGDNFGYSVAGVGTDHFLIGAPSQAAHYPGNSYPNSGQAHLYDKNGTLIATIPNPWPANGDHFGAAVAGGGRNCFVIGAPDKTIDGTNAAGMACLFDASGTLITAITNPVTAAGDHFGTSMAGAGTGNFVIGSPDKMIGGISNIGQAYLYDTSGTWVTTFTNPVPVAGDHFGASAAGMDSGRWMVGAYGKAMGGSNEVGQAYLYTFTRAYVPGLIADSVAAKAITLESLDITNVDTRYVLKAGDTMTGPLNVSAPVTASFFAGDGSGLTNLNLALFANSVLTNGATGLTLGGTFNGNVNGNATTATTANNFSGSLTGDVTGSQSATVVASVNGLGAANVAAGAGLANAATSANTASAIVKRDASGNFSAGTITASLAGNASTATLASNVVSGIAITNAFITNSVFAGNGSGLTNLNATALTGTLALAQLPAAVITNGQSRVALTGSFAGDGVFLTNLNSQYLLTGVVGSQLFFTNRNNVFDGYFDGGFAGYYLGNGMQLTNLNAAALTGTVADARLSANVALLNGTNLFTGTNIFAGSVQLTNTGNVIQGTFTGNGSGLTNLNGGFATLATNVVSGLAITNAFITNSVFAGNGAGLTNLNTASLTGMVADARLSANVALLNGTNLFTGTNIFAGSIQLTNAGNIIKGTFTGNGGGLTNLNAASLTGVFTGNVIGTASSATNFTGGLAGDVTGAQGATVVASVGGQMAANVAAGASLANAATNAATANTLVKRDASGSFSNASLTLTGNLNLPATTSSAGGIYAGTNLMLHSYGSQNFFAGAGAGNLTLSGAYNVGVGWQALTANTSGNYNTAQGAQALFKNTSGKENTAVGDWALNANTTGNDNTAIGNQALQYNTNGNVNTAIGNYALLNNTTGSSNIALGNYAGYNIITGSNNIAIGNPGGATDNGIIRIGVTGTHTATYLAGTVYADGVALTSDRNMKENFTALDRQTVLAKVASLPVTVWNYKTDGKRVRHIGPMAQDFQAAFQLGTDDKHIAVVDEGGVALAAIQGLNEKVESGKSQMAELKAENAELKQKNQSLEQRLEKLERWLEQTKEGAKPSP